MVALKPAPLVSTGATFQPWTVRQIAAVHRRSADTNTAGPHMRCIAACRILELLLKRFLQLIVAIVGVAFSELADEIVERAFRTAVEQGPADLHVLTLDHRHPLGCSFFCPPRFTVNTGVVG